MPKPFRASKPPRTLHLAAFAIGLLWLLAARVGADSAAEGIARLLHADLLQALLGRLFFLILLLTGFSALNWVALREGSVRRTNALPSRPTVAAEWQKGAALGWALLLLAVLPAALVGNLHPLFWFAPRAWGLGLLTALTLLVGSLATEVAYRGFLFQRLLAVIGPVSATIVLAGLYAFVATPLSNVTGFSIGVSILSAFVCSLAYLRTRGLWLGWGLRFGWLASMGVLFGLPIAGSVDVANLVAMQSSGRPWLTGGAYGPEGSLLAIFVLLGGLFAVYRITRDYAWDYTHEPIVAAGYAMDVPPPKAHAAMEAAAPPPPLVQILGAVPATSLLPKRAATLGSGMERVGGPASPLPSPLPSPLSSSLPSPHGSAKSTEIGEELRPAAEVDEARS